MLEILVPVVKSFVDCNFVVSSCFGTSQCQWLIHHGFLRNHVAGINVYLRVDWKLSLVRRQVLMVVDLADFPKVAVVCRESGQNPGGQAFPEWSGQSFHWIK